MTRRRLPHLYVIGRPLFVTFRLNGSLPRHRAFPPGKLSGGRAFLAMDRLLDDARSGPTHLRNTEIAEVVVDSLQYGVGMKHFDLHAWVLMPNHVHLLFTPAIDASKILGSLKSATAKRANLILGQTGNPFWQDESFDHVVRTEESFQRIANYIEANPVAASLVASPEDFPWSSAGANWQGRRWW